MEVALFYPCIGMFYSCVRKIHPYSNVESVSYHWRSFRAYRTMGDIRIAYISTMTGSGTLKVSSWCDHASNDRIPLTNRS